METKQKKPSMGRQKIEIKKIEKTSQLQVTFSKRRAGIFKKAGELGVLCGAEVAVIVTSPAGKVFSFGNPSVDSVVDRFLSVDPSPNANPNSNSQCLDPGRGEEIRRVEQLSKKYAKAVGKLEAEKEREKAVAEGLGGVVGGGGGGGGFWWDENVEGLGLCELEKYVAALEELKRNLMARVDELAAAAAASGSPANLLTSGSAVAAEPCGSFGFGFGCKPL